MFYFFNGIWGFFNNIITFQEIVIFNSIFSVIAFIIWFYFKFNVVKIILYRTNNEFSKYSVDFGFKRHSKNKLDDIHYIECKQNNNPWTGGMPYTITILLKNSKKISVYSTKDKEEVLDYLKKLQDFLKVKIEYPIGNSKNSWN